LKYSFVVEKKEKNTLFLCISEFSFIFELGPLFPINALGYQVLKGDKAGISAIRVNDKYRIEFSVSKIERETVITVCNIIELSNHYK